MNAFHRDIGQQAPALMDFVAACRRTEVLDGIADLRPRRILLTGMGASFHAALWGSHVLQSMGIRAVAVESSELLHFASPLIEDADAVVLISQSGTSAEVLPLLDRIPTGVFVLGIANNADSLLARRAGIYLDIAAGSETTVACKTYLNTLACVWLVAHSWAGAKPEKPLSDIAAVAARVGTLTDDAAAIGATWCDQLLGLEKIVFVGHGPHVPTARQGAMMMGEWMKRQAIGTGIGAFRHGLIEFTDADTGVVVLGAGGATAASVDLLSRDLSSYGATVVNVVEGRVVATGVRQEREMSEPLSALLDVVPIQIFVEAAARQLGIEPAFRHISKVIASI